MSGRIKLGTRGSALALRQVELVSDALLAAWPDLTIEVEKITTSGDRDLKASLARATPAGAKGLFTREIEEVLMAGAIDAAVHSLKDLPGQMTQELAIAAVLPRALSGDLLISREGFTLKDLPEGAVIGTSSVRREKQLLRLRPDLRICELRGNVPTRLGSVREDDRLSAIVLAEAGLERLGYLERPAMFEGLHAVSLAGVILPAVGQGIVAVQTRAEDSASIELLRAISHGPTWTCMRAERELLRLLNGDCQLPVGVRTRLDEERLAMDAIVFDQNSEQVWDASVEGSAAEPEKLAMAAFEQLYE